MDIREAYFRHFERKYFCEIIKRDFMEEVELGRDSGEVNSQEVKRRAWQHIGEKYPT